MVIVVARSLTQCLILLCVRFMSAVFVCLLPCHEKFDVPALLGDLYKMTSVSRSKHWNWQRITPIFGNSTRSNTMWPWCRLQTSQLMFVAVCAMPRFLLFSAVTSAHHYYIYKYGTSLSLLCFDLWPSDLLHVSLGSCSSFDLFLSCSSVQNRHGHYLIFNRQTAWMGSAVQGLVMRKM